MPTATMNRTTKTTTKIERSRLILRFDDSLRRLLLLALFDDVVYDGVHVLLQLCTGAVVNEVVDRPVSIPPKEERHYGDGPERPLAPDEKQREEKSERERNETDAEEEGARGPREECTQRIRRPSESMQSGE